MLVRFYVPKVIVLMREMFCNNFQKVWCELGLFMNFKKISCGSLDPIVSCGPPIPVKVTEHL